MNPVKRNVLFNAIRITPGHFGLTGRASYNGDCSWSFFPDEGGPSILCSRAEIYIPSLDKTKLFPPPGKLHRLEQKFAQLFAPGTFKIVGGRLYKPRYGAAAAFAKGMGGLVGKGKFMDELNKVMAATKKATVRHKTLKDLYPPKKKQKHGNTPNRTT